MHNLSPALHSVEPSNAGGDRVHSTPAASDAQHSDSDSAAYHTDNDEDHTGEIQIIFGPMFSGKTTELLRRIRRYQVAKNNCLVVKYKNDTRYDVETCEARSCAKLFELSEADLADIDVIGIDEGQFFSDCVEFAEQWANRGKIIVISALDATFERKAFGNILALVPLAEQVIKLNAVCMSCHKEGSFSKRISSESAVEVIGGADKYLSTCRRCFFKSNIQAQPSPMKLKRKAKEQQQRTLQSAAIHKKLKLDDTLNSSVKMSPLEAQTHTPTNTTVA